ncbi:Translation initiation factor 3 subunit c [Coemansia linderi]|uniref:Translation initiation factor 3 subunit c n=1 Tax=Coemansia linderi TaxID=2663919 RepID=A0ACC1KP39_9FUNG|nr:Translation initiation factor 3 subunit c [Coemansia linderi]
MSRFFRRDESSDSESDYSSSSSDDFSDEETQKKKQPTSGAGAGRIARAGLDSDDSEEEVKRTVKSTKDKLADQVTDLSRETLRAIRADEWHLAASSFDQLNKVVPKLIKTVSAANLPRSYVRSLAALEDALYENQKDKAALSKLSATDSRGYNQLKQRVRKHNKDFESLIAEFRANPTESNDDEEAASAESEEESSDDDQAVPSTRTAAAAVPSASKGKGKGKAAVAAASDSESDDSYWDSDSDESSSSSDSDDDGQVGIARWLKKTPTKEDTSAKKAKKDRAQRSQRAAAAQAAAAAEEDEDDDGFTAVGKDGKAVEAPKYNERNLNEHLLALIASRGRKNTNKLESIKSLETLLGVGVNALQKAKVLMALVSAQFDSAPSSGYLPIEMWHKAQSRLNELLSLLEANHQITILETGDSHDYEEDFEYNNATITLRGSIIASIDRLDDEFTKSLRNIDPHTPEYVERMRDTVPLYLTIVRAQGYFEHRNLNDSLCRVAFRRLEHLYYRTDQVNLHVESAAAALPRTSESHVVPASTAGNMEAIIHSLCTFLYLNADTLLRSRAMLMHVFNHALHKRYYVARDLLLMSHIQENVHQADVDTQVLYNRAIAQLGLAAFRLGKIQESFEHLVELMSVGHHRELLSQGVGQLRMHQLSPNEEQLQRQRQLPFHININLELLECVFLTSSMLLEIPFMASANINPDARRAPISRAFRRLLDYNERQVFIGPPENTRDHIMAAAKSLAAGEWEDARDFIQSIRIWSLLPDSEEITSMLASKIQVEALRTYLFTYATQFESVGLADLATMFDLPKGKVYALLARMVYHNEVQASLDEVGGVLVFSRTSHDASSRLQQTALALSNKANTFADINERVFELKINGGQAPGDRQQGGERGDRQQGDREGRPAQNRRDGGGGRDGRDNRDGQRGNQNRRDGGSGGQGGGHRGGRGGRRGGNAGGGGGQRRNDN